MTIPTLLFAFLIASLYGALYHLIRGGGFWRFILYLFLSLSGFFLGHWVGIWRGWAFLQFGSLNLGMCSVGSVLLLLLGDWLSRIDLRRQSKV